MNSKFYLIFVAFLAVISVSAQTVDITDADLVAGGTYNWTANNTYVLDGLVFLEEGGTLTIEAGTAVKFKATGDVTTGDNTSALIISRGAQIFAEGTAENPIIFTAQDDDLSDPNDFTAVDRGEWGGLIILGGATVARPSGVDNIEGIVPEPRTEYGGGDNPDDDDNSGVLKYISIRHGGDALASGDEINGLTLGGVGAGTEMDYIEVFANLDDGIEWFGGTVNMKHAAVSFCGDDAFDIDFGYRGKGQFWFSLQGPETSTGRAGEHDGANPDNQPPFSQPTIYNATYIGLGNGASAPAGDSDDFGILARDNFGGFYNNSIFTGFPAVGLAVEDRVSESSFERLQAEDLAFNNNTWYDFGAGNTAADLFIAVNEDEAQVASSSMVASMLAATNNTFDNPSIAGISRTPNGGLDPRLNAGSPDLGGNPTSDDPFFQQVTYRGAFGNNDNWLENWTALAEYGYLNDLVEEEDDFDCITITDADLVGGQTYNWTANNCYVLDGLVYLEEGGRLNIEPGTVVRGAAANNITTGDNTSALIITKDAQIFANGTATDPVIFTAEDDDLNIPNDFTAADRGEWGGLIILGNAVIARPGGSDNIEGITAEPRTAFGGDNNEDNSGRLHYVSIRHAGAALAPGDEINGLTLGGVGSGTEIDFIEVFANLDDGIEFFGGTVGVKHAAVSFCGDDSYDYDFGYRGKGQFWFSLQSGEVSTGRAGEHDGASPDNQPPFAQPDIYNATYIGLGVGNSNSGGDANDFALLLRDNAGGFYNNSIFTDFPGYGVGIEDRESDSAFERLQAGDLAFNNNTWFDFGEADFLQAIDIDEVPIASSSAIVQDIILNAGNTTNDPSIARISRIPNGNLDPRLNAGSIDLNGNTPSGDEFFQQVTYRGAFGNSNLWLEGWTALDNMGYLGDHVTEIDQFDCVNITDADLQGDQTYNWGNQGECYFLDGLVYLEEGGVLNIAPGTVIRGLNANEISTGDNTSALIISRGAQIFANGTAIEPVIFTASQDDLSDPLDFTIADRGEWGGLIILGDATIARPGGTDNIEGITAEPRTEYGGNNDDDNSGRLNYVSIRHGGAALAPGDEINGLTLGGVGSGTEMDFVEVIANLDDGIEWFGGTVDMKHAAVSACGDDAYDYDFGWRGRGQFWFSYQEPGTNTGRAGEHDGASPDNQAPFSQPTIYNATYVGLGENETASGGDGDDFAILMRDNAGGFYNNSIFIDFPGIGVAIEDRETESSFERLQAGDLGYNANFWFGFGAGTTATDLFVAVNEDEETVGSSTDVAATFEAAGNLIQDPVLNNMNRSGAIDPRPQLTGSPASGGAPVPSDSFFETVPYFGAFAPGNGSNDTHWLMGWSAANEYGIVDLTTSVNTQYADGFALDAPVPNPANQQATITFELPSTAVVDMMIVDALGRPVMSVLANTRLSEGVQTTFINTAALPQGMYVVVLEAEGTRLLQKLIVNR